MKNRLRVFSILCLTAHWLSVGFPQNRATGTPVAQSAPRESQAAQPPNCIHVLYCLFNQEAAATDPAGIHKYSRDLVDLILPNQWTYGRSPSGRMEEYQTEFLGEKYANKLADRLVHAEQMARAGNGKLVPEAAVAKAFNDLMQGIGAPPSWRANDASVHGFREHATAIHAFSTLFSADRNGTNCNPGEAVFILSLLLEDNGVLYNGNLDTQAELMQWNGRQAARGWGFGVAHMEAANSSASQVLSLYPRDHGQAATIALFNRVISTLGL